MQRSWGVAARGMRGWVDMTSTLYASTRPRSGGPRIWMISLRPFEPVVGRDGQRRAAQSKVPNDAHNLAQDGGLLRVDHVVGRVARDQLCATSTSAEHLDGRFALDQCGDN